MENNDSVIDNITYTRFAIIGVEATHGWLTCDGDYPDCNGGWEEIRKDLEHALAVLRYPSRGIRICELRAWFEDWEGTPEIKE